MGNGSKNQEALMWPDEPMIESYVRYILDLDGKLFVFENVPARVNATTGEQFFSPATVRRIQEIALSSYSPTRTVQANVYESKNAV